MGAFTGGLFLSISLLLLLPRANYFISVGWDNKLPLAYLICAISFSMLLFFEKIVIENDISIFENVEGDVLQKDPLLLE